MTRALFISYCPPIRKPDDRELRWGRSSAKLCDLFSLTLPQLKARFDWLPLLAQWPGYDEDPSRRLSTRWRAPQRREARAAAEALAPTLSARPVVILLGRPAREAFRPWLGESPKLFRSRALLGTQLIPWPSASSGSRWWCCPDQRDMAAQSARAVLAEMADGLTAA